MFTGSHVPASELPGLARKIVGMTLKNGAVVVDAGVRRSYFIVLAVKTAGVEYEPYVVWALSPRDGETFWGDYHSDLEEAIEAFRTKLAT